MPPITIQIPTQAQWAQIEADRQKNSPLAIYQSYLTNKAGGGVAPTPNPLAPGVAPGSNPTSPTVISPVPTPAPIATPQINYAPQNNEEWIKATAEMINQLNMQAQQQMNQSRIPGAKGLEAQSSANIGNALSGALPDDVVYQLGQRAAEWGVGTGSPHGANTNADYLRAIGLNSLQLQNTGQDWLTAALARNPSAPLFDISKLFITPSQATGFGLEQANFQLNQQRQQTEIANANAQRQLQSDLANAQNQLERDRLVWQYEQNRLQRENALRIAEMEANRRAGYGYGGGGRGGGFNPAGNWQGGAPTPTVTPTPFQQPWHDPGIGTGISDDEWNQMLYGLYDTGEQGAPPAGTYYNPNTNTSDYNPFGQYFTPGGGIDQGGMSEDELDWLYNVGG